MKPSKTQRWGQKLAILGLFGLIAIACGKPFEPAEINPMTGYAAPQGYREKSEVVNPEFESFQPSDQKANSENQPPQDMRDLPPPVPMIIEEHDEHNAHRLFSPSAKFNQTESAEPTPTEPKEEIKVDPKTEEESGEVEKEGSELDGLYTSINQESSEQAVNFYAKYEVKKNTFVHGRLLNAKLFPEKGPCFYTADYFRAKNVQYSTTDLQKVLEYGALKLCQSHKKNTLVGSLSSQFGGVQKGHQSHQNGLDADVYLFRRNDQDSGWIVRNNKISSNFDVVSTYEFIKVLQSTGRLRKVFVHQAIKKALCTHSRLINKPNDPLQRSIVSWGDSHPNHMHIRITCPLNSPRCIEQLDFDNNTDCPRL